MDFRSLPCTLLGYSSNHKGYLCFHSPSSRLYVSRFVAFDESVFPAASVQSNACSETSIPLPIVTDLLGLAQSTRPLPITPLPTPPLPTAPPMDPLPTSPHHQRPTISSSTKSTTPSLFRVASNKTHTMTTRSDSHLVQRFITALNTAFALKDLGALNFFLGIEIKSLPQGIALTQAGYITDVLRRCNMVDVKPFSTPTDPSSRLQLQGEPFPDPTLYRRIVGSLQYATITRPDIAYAVNRVCQYMHAPTLDHWQAVKRILRYLKGTLHHQLCFRPTTSDCLLAYSDAGWISDSDDSRSQYGFAVFHGPNLISWTSKKQRVVARSSTEAEYRALAYTSAELLWIKQLLQDLHCHLPRSPIILCDNVGAQFMCQNPVIQTRSKHITLDFHFVREQVEAGDLRIQHVSSVEQLADIFTKPLSKDRVAQLRSKLQVLPTVQLAGGC
ncbi:hypothetical protein V2J09_017849 [Rumex salicifolius]